MVERGRERVAVEIKAGRGGQDLAGRTLAKAMSDAGAQTGWIVDQAPGIDPIRPGISRRGFAETPGWLP